MLDPADHLDAPDGAGMIGAAFHPFNLRDGGATISSSFEARADEPRTRSFPGEERVAAAGADEDDAALPFELVFAIG